MADVTINTKELAELRRAANALAKANQRIGMLMTECAMRADRVALLEYENQEIKRRLEAHGLDVNAPLVIAATPAEGE